MQKPSLARMVIAQVDPAYNNGSDLCPAIVTRVWSAAPGVPEHWIINVRLIPDSSQSPIHRTSVALYETEQEAREHGGLACFWPPRV